MAPASASPRLEATVPAGREQGGSQEGKQLRVARSPGGRLSGGDLGRLLSTGHTVSLQQIFPQRCYKTCIWQSAAALQALLSLVKRRAGAADGGSKSELTIKISLEIAAK